MKSYQEHFIDRHRGGEKALLVQMDTQQLGFAEDLAEFEALALAASVKSLGVVTGKLTRPNAKFYVGLGKVEEIAQQVLALGIEVVLFNHPLTAAQGRNLKKINLPCFGSNRIDLRYFCSTRQNF